MPPRRLESWLAGAERRPRTVFLVAFVAAILGIGLVSRISFDANILRLLPQRSPIIRSFQTFLRDFGSLDHLYLVFESSSTGIGEHTALVDAYIDGLRRAPEIASVDAQIFGPDRDWSYLFDHELYLLGPDAARQALARFRPSALDEGLAHARDLLSVPSSDITAYVRQDPLGLLTMLRDRMGREKGFAAFDPSQEGYVSADGHSRLVTVKPKGSPFDNDFCKRLFHRLEQIEAEARAAARADDEQVGAVAIQAAGAYRVSLESEQLIRHEAMVNSFGSMVLLLLIVFGLFRTPWILLYGSVPLGLAALLALGLSGLVQGRLSPATSGSAAMLFGLGIDGVVVLYVRFLEEREAGRTAADAVVRLAPTARSVMLAQATTAATFLALLFIDFPTLQDLGALVGIGILLCCALTLALMPAFLGRDHHVRRAPTLRSRWLGTFVRSAFAPIVGIGAVATVGLGIASTQLHLDTSIDRLQARTRGSDIEREIAERFSLPRDILLVLNEGADLERLVTADARLTAALAARAPDVTAAGISMLLPTAESQASVARELGAAGLSPTGVAQALGDAAARAGFRPDAFDPFVERIPRLLDADARITYDGLIAHGLDPIASRFVIRANGRYETVTYLYPKSPADLASLATIVRGVDPAMQLTGVPMVNRDTSERFLPQFRKGIAIGGVAVTILVFWVFRTVRLTLLTLVPTVAGFIWSAGILALARVELDLFSAFAAVTFIGITMDYSIHVLYRYAVEGSRDMGQVLTETGAAILIACLTTLVGFGTLVGSSYPPLRTFGVVSLVTLTCCLAASLLLLPALVLQMEQWSRPAP